MAGGLAALLDDVAAIAKMASAASTKAVGVVIDDTAVTPQYVTGFSPARELPMIAKIARGSLINKAIIIALLMVLSAVAPWILTPLLMLGGFYLVFEGAEKIWEYLLGHGEGHTKEAGPVSEQGPVQERAMVRSAITTDFVLSAEIMMISLNEITTDSWVQRLIALVVVAILITVLVYGVVALIVKIDDVGLALSQRERTVTRTIGRLLLNAMSKVLRVLSVVGVIAMLWVGGHILVNGTHELGWNLPYELLHSIGSTVDDAAGAVAAWFADAGTASVAGFLVGSIFVAVLMMFRKVTHRE